MYEYEKKKLLSNVNEELLENLKKGGCFIAGGSVTSVFTNKEIADIDIYVPNKKAAVAICGWAFGCEDVSYCASESFAGIVVSTTERSITLKDKYTDILYQVIMFDNFSSPEEIFNKFDFTVCMGAYDCAKEEFVLHEDFLKHCSQRQLHFNENTSYPFVSALRVDKYKKKGYDISRSTFIKILLTCAAKPINSWDELISQIAGLYGDVSGEAFDTDKEFSLEEAISQIEEASEKSKTLCTEPPKTELEDLIEFIHGDDPLPEQEAIEFKEGYYYKRVREGGVSEYDGNFTYKVGELVGGKSGIWVDSDPKKPCKGHLDYVVELKPTESTKEKQNRNAFLIGRGEKILEGELLVTSITYSPYNSNVVMGYYEGLIAEDCKALGRSFHEYIRKQI